MHQFYHLFYFDVNDLFPLVMKGHIELIECTDFQIKLYLSFIFFISLQFPSVLMLDFAWISIWFLYINIYYSWIFFNYFPWVFITFYCRKSSQFGDISLCILIELLFYIFFLISSTFWIIVGKLYCIIRQKKYHFLFNMNI